jgi:putative hemolysin
MTEIVIIILLMVLNGVFSMSEAAVIGSRKARLQQAADKGDVRARAAIKLVDDPNRFLSTVQIGITLIGILAGVFGGATVAATLAAELRKLPVPFIVRYASPISYGLIVLLTTYLSLIIGELAPKRLALKSPERIAMLVAIPMRTLSKIAKPIVALLSVSTDAVLWLLRVRDSEEPPVTGEEIKAMMQQGVDAGVFVEAEHDMVEGVFKLGERRVSAVMTPRPDVTWLDINLPLDDIRNTIIRSHSSRFPVCEGDLDHVIGIVEAKDMLVRCLSNEPFDLRPVMSQPMFVLETMPAPKVLEMFKENGKEIAIVANELGGVQGLVTLQDFVGKIVGDTEEMVEVVKRDDGSWLLDGIMPVDEFKEALGIDDVLPGEHGNYKTLGGFVMAQLGRIPSAADQFKWGNFCFEVMDMDGNRVDKVMVATVEKPVEEAPIEAGEVRETE